jgi:Glycosyl hydrolases family 39.
MSIVIKADKIIKKQPNFWNGILFHPTDAIEDAWGQKILCDVAENKAAHIVRIYSMFEDIVTRGDDGSFLYDFSLNDERIDFLLSHGFRPLIAYAFVPPFLTVDENMKSAVAQNKTRYKGKMICTSEPADYKAWGDICYNYTKHLCERYGEDEVSRWYLQCYNEPDIREFLLSDLPDDEKNNKVRLEIYKKLYREFENAVRRVSERFLIGGPASGKCGYIYENFLRFVKEEKLKLDYVAIHDYGTNPADIQNGKTPITVRNSIDHFNRYAATAYQYFAGIDIIMDEWGVCCAGFYNMRNFPVLEFREDEVFSAYFAKMLTGFVEENAHIREMMICLSGQHEMSEEFTGYRGFFTLNHIRKPIYNSYILAAKLGENILEASCDTDCLSALPTQRDDGSTAVLLSYASEYFDKSLSPLDEKIKISGIYGNKKIKIWRIDKNTVNPYTTYKEKNFPDILEPEQIDLLKNEGIMKPIHICTINADGELFLDVSMSANGVMLIEIE